MPAGKFQGGAEASHAADFAGLLMTSQNHPQATHRLAMFFHLPCLNLTIK